METPVLFTNTKIFDKLEVDVQRSRAEGCGTDKCGVARINTQ